MASTILIVSRHSPPSYGPAWERIRHMALASKRFFGNAIVLTLGRDVERKTGKAESNVLIYKVKLTRESPYPINAYFDPIKFILLCVHGFLLSLRYKPLCILTSMPPSEAGLSAWVVAKFLGIKLFIDLRDDWESAAERNLSRYIPAELLKALFWLTRKVYSSSTAILVATQTIAERVKKRRIKTSMILVPNGADTSIFFPRDKDSRRKIRRMHSLPQNKVVMIYCGSGVNPYYRLDRVLSSVKSLGGNVKKRVFLVFYLYNGIENLKKMKELLRISGSLVDVRGPVPRSVLAEVMAACDIGMVPFNDEPYLLCARSSKLYEYLSAGLHVIGSGPEGGELDLLFSSNSQLGSFDLPKIRNFISVFFHVVNNEALILGDNDRAMRHEFILENYDRRKIAVKAMSQIYSLSVSGVTA